MKPSAFQIIDHGVQHEQYFQGCGVAYTRYDAVFTGIGVSAHEALEDGLECAAQSGWETEGIVNVLSVDTTVPEDAEGCYYYVSIRLKRHDLTT